MKGPPASGYNLATMTMTVRVNGEPREVDADPATPLLWVLRDHFGMTGTKFGCGIGRFQIGNVKRHRRSRHSQRMAARPKPPRSTTSTNTSLHCNRFKLLPHPSIYSKSVVSQR
jgi:hypothetical protein